TVLLLFVALLACTGRAQDFDYALRDAFPRLTFDLPVDFVSRVDITTTGPVERLFVVQQQGNVVTMPNNPAATATTPFLDLRDRVRFGGEQGLLGLVFHPAYPDSAYCYVNYVAPNPTGGGRSTRVSRFRLLNDTAADPTSELVLMEIDQPFQNHNAGDLTFGNDGLLYIPTGDGGSGGDPINAGQDRTTLLGKVLRIDVDQTAGGLAYAIPLDNPLVGNGEGFREEIYAWGLRNPWRVYLDPLTDSLWVGDVGQNELEEISIVGRGDNLGWRIMEGDACFNPTECDQTGLKLPVWTYAHDAGDVSITGGVVYRGADMPALRGTYVYGDYVSGRIWALSDASGNPTNELLLRERDGRLSSFGLDAAGELYVLNHAGSGKVYRLVQLAPTGTDGPTAAVFEVSPNPSATFTFRIQPAVSRPVTLRIFDAAGRTVTTLLEEALLPADVERRVAFDAANLPAGLYVARLRVGNTTLTRRLVRP
ncbi:MAG: PQQ-dependent sugar dehydrogenase, partial [Catalinimonas sp.]